jgi:SNF2 family DNA or RNA helicase
MGQRKTVRVFQLIAEDTIESRVLDIRELTSPCIEADNTEKRKDALVAQVSGVVHVISG